MLGMLDFSPKLILGETLGPRPPLQPCNRLARRSMFDFTQVDEFWDNLGISESVLLGRFVGEV